MKIAFFSDVLFPVLGGIETHVLETAQALAQMGHEIVIIAPGSPPHQFPTLPPRRDPAVAVAGVGSDNHAPPESIRYIFVKGLPLGFIWPNFRFSFPPHLYFELRKWRPEVIHFHTAGPVGLSAILMAKWLRYSLPKKSSCWKPLLVGTFHSYFMTREYLFNYRPPSLFTKLLHSNVVGWLEGFLWAYARFFYDRGDVIVSPSAWVAQDLKDHGFKRPIKVVHNGTPLQAFGRPANHQVIEELRSKYGLGESVLLYVGRLSREKCLNVLLHAGERCQGSGVRCQLLIVGDGPAEGELRGLSRELDITNQVIFLGRIEHENLARSGVFEAAKAFVTASTSENQPITLIEALAKGLPIIGVKARGVPELVKENGLLAAPNDPADLAEKILRLLSDPELRIKCGQESKEMAQAYSIDHTAQNLLQVYQKGETFKARPY